jgi:glycosyltransferase involved in cell wall biosynthesis
MLDTTIVIPCYNEAQRLDIDCFVRFVTGDPPCRLLLVDDGSSDDTLAVLEALRECAPLHVDVLALERNQGKAEAVRRGVLAAMAQGAKYVGYWDADLATPLEAIADFRAKLVSDQQLQAIFGSRVRMLGRNIRRQLVRHLLGRAFATGASLTLGLGVYDTQCGAKLFRADRQTQQLFEKPFLTNWIFDVELIARMLGSGASREAVAAAIYEMPLNEWYDVAGSKVRPRDFFKALFELNQIYWNYLRGIPDVVEGEAAEGEAAEAEKDRQDPPADTSPEVDSKPRKAMVTQP